MTAISTSTDGQRQASAAPTRAPAAPAPSPSPAAPAAQSFPLSDPKPGSEPK
jgi:hypothetical protein